MKKNLDLWIILISITAVALFTTVWLAVRPLEVKSFEKLEHVSISEYKTLSKDGESYFVLLYDSKSDRYKEIEDSVLAYNEYARTHKDAFKIYVIDYQTNKKIIDSSNFNITEANLGSSIPCLATVTSAGNVTKTKTTVSDIANHLEKLIQGRA